MEIIKEHDVYTPNEKFKKFLETKAVGFGIDISALQQLQERQANPAQQQETAAATAETVQVEGMKLEKQTEQEKTEEDDMSIYWLSMALFMFAIFGFMFELFRQKKMLQA